VTQNVPDGPHKLFLGSIPSYLGEEQVMELLQAFGELKAFVLVRDSHTGASKGFAFVEYVDHEVEDIACQGLTGVEVGDKKLVLQRSSTTGGGFKGGNGATGPGGMAAVNSLPMLPMDILQSIGRNLAPPTTVLLLLNLISEEDVRADEDFEGSFFYQYVA
jgi:splicing factor U2AF subunit